MKQLLLSWILIGATGACNEMTPEEKYREAQNLEKTGQLTLKHVNENVVNNEYVMNHKEEFLQYTLSVQDNLSCIDMTSILNDAKGCSEGRNTDFLDEVRPEVNDILGCIRILELAHEYCKGVDGYDKLKPMDSFKEHKDLIKKLFIDTTDDGTQSILSLVANYFGYSY